MKNEDDRLAQLKKRLQVKKHKGYQLYWIKYNPGAEFDYDIEDATEDIEWMIYEIQRLRDENEKYREFVDSYKEQIEKELKQ